MASCFASSPFFWTFDCTSYVYLFLFVNGYWFIYAGRRWPVKTLGYGYFLLLLYSFSFKHSVLMWGLLMFQMLVSKELVRNSSISTDSSVCFGDLNQVPCLEITFSFFKKILRRFSFVIYEKPCSLFGWKSSSLSLQRRIWLGSR